MLNLCAEAVHALGVVSEVQILLCAQLPRRGAPQAEDNSSDEGGYRDWQEDDSPPVNPDSSAAGHESAEQVPGSVAPLHVDLCPGQHRHCRVRGPIDDPASDWLSHTPSARSLRVFSPKWTLRSPGSAALFSPS